MNNPFVILLHGVGSNGHDLEVVGEFFKSNFPALEYVSPNAPFNFMNSPNAYQWFSITGVTEGNRYARVVEARSSFDEKIREILKENQMENQLERVVFCGFSQGAIMALDAVVSGRWPIGGVISIAGRLTSPIKSGINKNTKVLLIHGEADTVIPVTESQLAYQELHAAEMKVELNIFPFTAHQITQSILDLSVDFLKSN
ncbi:dienelactone hydrolase family protein [Acinetobacter baumannii]|uniref:alpha/beta hydrolase n=1 Tax=Acinetobacter baumannii TaxID=470 RepID=UPI002340BFCA|nr:dienelactone hydrolase family protein [Acinetobacter baumannii]HCQ9958923.1 dienelactone hydrolase family protein [Acinetobacter baumannii]